MDGRRCGHCTASTQTSPCGIRCRGVCLTNAHPQPALSLWKGQTIHVRYQPFERRFAYDLVLIDLDIDRLDEAAASSALFSVNAPGLFAFRTEDHGA
ncbi:MAG TPA: hypothetical protein DHU81_10975, partial [Hyphomonas sp.]|nr:hypothetical protein [Hyphomonas sp.]